jgi:AraC-like DNA-binding protein
MSRMRSPLSWAIDLGAPPEVSSIGRGLHGIGCQEERYLLRVWTLHFYGYEAELVLDGSRVSIKPGYVGIIAPGVRQEYFYRGRAEHLYAHFTPVASSGASPSRIAAMGDLGSDFGPMFERFDDLRRVAPMRPGRVAAGLWDILWELAERTAHQEERGDKRHWAVGRACRTIESGLAGPLGVKDVAHAVGISTPHLNRLFRTQFGDTVTGYVRRKRVERARHLLLHSGLPIKEVACEVGLSDLQLFNKVIRRSYGVPPRALRAQGPAAAQLLDAEG